VKTTRRSTRRSFLAALGVAAISVSAVGAAMPAPRATGTSNPSSDLRPALNSLLQEHVYLAAAATGSALGGRQSEFQAAAGALDANSVALSKAIGSVYGADAETAFLALWRKHIGFVVDYTTGVATKDKKKQDQAVNALVGYTRDFGAFIASANPNLTTDAVAGLVKDHVLTLKDVIDAQASMNPAKAYAAARTAASHMSHIADPLAAAIAKQFPTRFGAK
jgi:hypothetical protein